MTSTAVAKYLLQAVNEPSCPYVVTADLASPLGLEFFAEQRPDRFLNVGVAEQMMIGVSAGLSAAGHPVIAATFASFALRAVEAFRHLVVYDGLHVVLVGSHSGLSAGPNGPSHQCTDDLGVFGAMDRVVCFSPRSAPEAVEALRYCATTPGQYYVRLAKWAPPARSPLLSDPHADDKLFFASYGYRGTLDIAVLSHGVTWNIACHAIEHLRLRGINACAFHIGRFPSEDLSVVARVVLTIEDHSSNSGIGRIAPLIIAGADHYLCLGAPWPLGSDDAAKLYEAAGLSVAGILRGVEEFL
jgi:transketolase